MPQAPRNVQRVRAQLTVTVLFLSIVAGATNAAAAPSPRAIADVAFSDTSGEARDQRDEHAAHLQMLAARLRTDLAASGKFRIVELPCDARPCGTDVEGNLERARKAGAKFVVFVVVHKTSTLLLSLPVQVIDTASGKVVFGRYHSFRGDTDEAWERAGRFLVRELISALGGPP
jgi:hypothetical protein